jgi:L-Ala-D/L-Glu epimerase / N-acetyl-D-glutamate racemase
MESLQLEAAIEKWPLMAPFRITGRTWEFVEVLVVRVRRGPYVGYAEAAGVYYHNETPESMLNQVDQLRTAVESDIGRRQLQSALPAGGARNALDCALWDLEAKVSGRSVWEIAGLQKPHPLLTTFTCGAAKPSQMADTARKYTGARAIKLKLTGEPEDAERVLAVREARPDVWLGIDANQGFTRQSLERLLPTLTKAGVELIEQPFPVGQDALLDGFQSPIAIAADESAQTLEDVAGLSGRFNVVNIKLDKCGGLTEALEVARRASELGLSCMVGNMLGTSLGMAPGYLVGQQCSVVDLDGPIFLKSDRPVPVQYIEGLISCPETLWGGPSVA